MAARTITVVLPCKQFAQLLSAGSPLPLTQGQACRFVGVYSFFTEVRVIGGENVPANGPIIVYFYLSNQLPDCAPNRAVPSHARSLFPDTIFPDTAL